MTDLTAITADHGEVKLCTCRRCKDVAMLKEFIAEESAITEGFRIHNHTLHQRLEEEIARVTRAEARIAAALSRCADPESFLYREDIVRELTGVQE